MTDAPGICHHNPLPETKTWAPQRAREKGKNGQKGAGQGEAIRDKRAGHLSPQPPAEQKPLSTTEGEREREKVGSRGQGRGKREGQGGSDP